MSSDAVNSEQLQEMRQQHIGRLLQQVFRGFNNRAIARLRQRGHTGLTLAHTLLLSHLDLEGTRITVLADRAGITKQSMGQLVLDLEKRGYIERRADSFDRRATLVFFTCTGWQFLRDAYEIKKEIEAEYQAIIGEEEMRQLRATLMRLLEKADSDELKVPPT
jgi:DNA-binding MarR family transcriptional regulator